MDRDPDLVAFNLRALKRTPPPLPEHNLRSAFGQSEAARSTAFLENEKRLQKQLRSTQPYGDSAREIDVFVHGSIDGALVEKLRSTLHQHPWAKRVRVHVDSQGGLVVCAQTIVAALSAHRGHKTLFVNYAASGALLIVMAVPALRIAHPNARFLHHVARSQGGKPAADTTDWASSLLAQRVPADVVATWLLTGENDISFDAYEALAWGVVNRVEAFEPVLPLRTPKHQMAEVQQMPGFSATNLDRTSRPENPDWRRAMERELAAARREGRVHESA